MWGANMGVCNLCGSKTERLFETMIEGASMNVCSNCAKLGKVIKEISQEPIEELEENTYVREITSKYNGENSAHIKTVEVLVSDYGRRVKNAREQKGFKQEKLAKLLAIKESLLHNIESSHFEPNDELIHKLEKYLHIKLTEQIEDKKVNLQQSDSGPMTLGDMIKFKKKK